MKIAVLAGDGIGPEIVAQAVKVLDVLKRDGLQLELEHAPYGGAGYDAHGDPLPEITLKLARQADAVLCGAVGGPKYDALPRDKRPEQGLLRIRKELDYSQTCARRCCLQSLPALPRSSPNWWQDWIC